MKSNESIALSITLILYGGPSLKTFKFTCGLLNIVKKVLLIRKMTSVTSTLY